MKVNEKNKISVNLSDYEPQRFGLSYNPPQIILEYQKPSSGKLYHHKIRLQKFFDNAKISEIIDDIYKNHNSYLNHERINKALIIQLVEKLREKINLMNEEKEKKIKEENEQNKDKKVLEYDIDTNENLNVLSTEELNLRKKHMDKFYDKNYIKVGDKNFIYDIRKDFSNEGNAEWDDDE